MEFALQSVKALIGKDNVIVASVGTDGTDGPTDAAGAFVTGNTFKQSEEKGVVLDKYLSDNDSYHFFEKVGGLIKTGPTNTNVMDIRIMLVDKEV